MMKQLTINNNQPQYTNWCGFGGVYHAYMFQPDKFGRQYTDEQCQIELDRIARIHLRIARTFYRYDFNWTDNGWDWNTPKMEGLSRWCLEMAKRNVDVALNASWWCPLDVIGTDESPSPFSIGVDEWNVKCDRYAQWVDESLHQLVEVRGHTNIKYLVLFTEPCWDINDSPIGKEQWECWFDLAKAVHEQLTKSGRRNLVKLLGPNEGSTDSSPMVKWMAERAGDIIDIYSSHNYVMHTTNFDYDTYDDWKTWMQRGLDNCKNTGKPYWFDEYGFWNPDQQLEHIPQQFRWTKAEYGTHVALVNCVAINLGVQSTTMWTLFDQQWPNNTHTGFDCWFDGEHRHGIAPTLKQSDVPYPGYYGAVLLPRYLGGKGSVSYKTNDDGHLHIAALQTETGDFTVLVVNAEKEEVDFNITLTKTLKKKLHRHLFDPAKVMPDKNAEIPGIDKIFDIVDTCFSDKLPQNAVAIYTTEDV